MEDPERWGTPIRGDRAAGVKRLLLNGLEAEFVSGVVATQLLVPVLPEGAVARVVGAIETRGVVRGAETVGIRTMVVPLELWPREERPLLAPELLEMPREEDEPSEMPREELDPDDEAPDKDPLDLDGLMKEPMELPLLRELLPLELEPRDETLPLELEPRDETLPLELLALELL